MGKTSVKFLYFLVVFLLTKSVQGKCDYGCLQCSQEQECLLCDMESFYFLEKGKCVWKNLNNCLIPTPQGMCQQCNFQFYMDNGGVCREVPSYYVDLNCKIYRDYSECLVCNDGYFVQNLSCVENQYKIQNCQQVLYSSIGTSQLLCQTCSEGFRLSSDQSQCVMIPISENCLINKDYECSLCDNNYSLDANFYEDYYFSQQNPKAAEIQLFILTQGKSQLSENFVQNQCISNTVQNCQIQSHSQLYVCLKCQQGFYLKRGKCFKQQPQPIPYCKVYQNLTTCSQCLVGYYLGAGNTDCLMMTSSDMISFCIEYSSFNSFISCTKCSNHYYLSNNLCVVRTQSNISNCTVLNKNQDSCQECLKGYDLSSNSLQCQRQLPNCQTTQHNSGSYDTCILCNNKMYWDSAENKCLSGTVTHCLKYALSQINVCQTCENGFFLLGNACHSQLNIEFCDEYSNSQKGVCSKCQNQYISVSQSNSCVLNQIIKNCQKYTSQGGCQLCSPGFVVNSLGECQVTFLNFCLQIDSNNNCVECVENYVTTPYQADCVSASPQKLLGCANIDYSNDSVACRDCNSNYVPQQTRRWVSCLSDFYSIFFNKYPQGGLNGKINPIQNCKNFIKNTSQINRVSVGTIYGLGSSPNPKEFQCLECQEGFYLSKDLSQCLSYCNGPVRLIELQIDSVMKTSNSGFKNVCQVSSLNPIKIWDVSVDRYQNQNYQCARTAIENQYSSSLQNNLCIQCLRNSLYGATIEIVDTQYDPSFLRGISTSFSKNRIDPTKTTQKGYINSHQILCPF